MATKKTAAKKKKTTAKAAKTTATTATKKPKATEPPPALIELCALLGEEVKDDDVADFIARHRLKLEKTDKIKGEPHTIFWRNDENGIVVTADDGVCVAVDVDDVFEGDLFAGVSFGAARSDVAAALGDVVEKERFYDTFQRDELRVVGQFAGDKLVGLRVEPWQHQLQRAAREEAENDAVPAVVVERRPPLPEPWLSTLPSVTALRALLGKNPDETVLAVLERDGALRRDQGQSGAVLRADSVDVFVGVDGTGDNAVVSLVSVGSGWNGAYEEGLVAGAAGRKEVRAAYGPPTVETKSFDLWERDGVRIDVSYLDGRVFGWRVNRA